MLQDIEIEIMLDGKFYGGRIWPAVPRVGDYLSLCNRTIIARVEDVVWGKSNASDFSYPEGRLSVLLVCTTAPDETKKGD